MNKLNSKTTRIVSALALSAGLFSVSNSAMASTCSDGPSPAAACTTGNTSASDATYRKVVVTATSKNSITGQGVGGKVLIFNSARPNYVASKNFVGSTNLTYVSQTTGQKYKATVLSTADISQGKVKATIYLSRV